MPILDRNTAARIERFADECELAFAFGPTDGYIYYSVSVEIIHPNGQAAKEATVGCFNTKVFSQPEVTQTIVALWEALVREGKIGNTGNPAQPLKGGVTLTGNPLDDMMQVADALARRETPIH